GATHNTGVTTDMAYVPCLRLRSVPGAENSAVLLLQTYQGVGKWGLCGSTGSLGLMPVESLAADLPAGRFAPLVPVVRRPASFPSFLGLSSPLGAPGFCAGSGEALFPGSFFFPFVFVRANFGKRVESNRSSYP